MKLQKIRVYLNAEFMDVLDYFASFYATTNSEILRFSLRSKDGFYKKPKRAQSVFYKQKRIKKDFEAIKKSKQKFCLCLTSKAMSLLEREARQNLFLWHKWNELEKRQQKKDKK